MEYLEIILLVGCMLFGIFFWYVTTTEKYRLTKVKEEGIKVVYNNIWVWDNYVSYYSKKYGEDKAKALTFENVPSHEYIEMLKENQVYIREYDETGMVIPWEYVRRWQIKRGDWIEPIGGKYSLSHGSYDMSYIEAVIAKLPIPLRVFILVDPIDKKIIRFRKMVGDKEL